MNDEGIDDHQMSEDDVAAFIELPSQLEKNSATSPIFTDRIYQAVLRHAKTLESVSLMLRECSVNNAINTGKLLANCPNLRHAH